MTAGPQASNEPDGMVIDLPHPSLKRQQIEMPDCLGNPQHHAEALEEREQLHGHVVGRR